jgi:phosphatidylglycerol:prolipoprotein diacylglycerol transferase
VRPVLVQFDGIAIPSYGVMLVVSFLFALWFARRHAQQFNISPIIIENVAFYLMIGVIIGGRLLYVIFHWQLYENDILGIVRIWEGGMMFFGGFIGGFLAAMFYLKREKIPILHVADLVAPAIALGQFFTRIGCFLNGCCFGTPSTLPWAIKFPDYCAAGASPVGDQALHPTQLYSSLFGLALFLFLKNILFKPHHRGAVFALYLMFSGGFRFGIDFIRYYEDSANFWINQIVALGLVVVGLILYFKKPSRHD